MNNIFLLVGGIFSTSLYFFYKKPNFYYNIFLKGNDFFYKIKNYQLHNFKINSIHEAKYDNEDYLIKGKKIYERSFYSDFFYKLNIQNLNKEKYIIDYFLYGKNYRIIGNKEIIKKLNTQKKNLINNNKIVMSTENNNDITNLISKYEGLYGDFNYNLTNKHLRVKDIIKDDNTNINNEITIITSRGNLLTYTKNDILNNV